MRLLKFFARSVLTITLLGIAAKANAQSIDELYQAAIKEGTLSLNFGGPDGLYAPSDTVLFAAVASHYIQDAHMPLHASNNNRADHLLSVCNR